jgi:quinol monooxygenase YgiN
VVIVAGAFEVDPDRREEFISGRIPSMQRSRAEQGCLEYTLCADPIDPTRVLLIERWGSQGALDAHLAALRSGATAEEVVPPRSASIVVYDIASETVLI